MQKKLHFTGLILLTIFSIAIIFDSCKKEEKCPEVDYTAIDKTVDNAQQWYVIAIEGTGPGEYPPPAKSGYQKAINVARSVRTKNCVTQQELDNAENYLINSTDYFNSKRIPGCPVVDYTEIDQSIANAQQIHDNAVEGYEPGEYPPGSKAELQQAIDNAQSVRDKQCVSQDELNTATSMLVNATEEFESEKIPDLSKNLVAHWLFNGNGNDASGNGHDGTASAGHANWGGGMPELATDRHGNDDYCYKFVDGGNFVVPNSPAFIPAEITISVWMKLYGSWAHNYIISNDIWHSWKYQLQDANKPFFTAHIMKDDGTGEEAWIDKDSNFGILDFDKWYHVVLTYTSGKMIFYINGEEVQEWDDFPTGTFIEPHAGIDICIGQALPTDDYDNGDHEWQEWLGYFKGWMDDMRFYNVILTDIQVKALYDYENVTTIE
jgi:hypothetical protein